MWTKDTEHLLKSMPSGYAFPSDVAHDSSNLFLPNSSLLPFQPYVCGHQLRSAPQPLALKT